MYFLILKSWVNVFEILNKSVRIVFVLAIVLSVHSVRGQDSMGFKAPDYEEIKKQTNDKNTPYYYPKLLKRFKENDTTLSEHEIYLIYYGSFFNNELSSIPVADLQFDDSIKAISKKDTLSDTDYKQLLRLYREKDQAFPLELRTLNALYNLYKKTNDNAADFYRFKLMNLYSIILATGDGRSINSGFHVVSVSDEYVLLSILGFKFGGEQRLIDHCDFLTVEPNQYKLDGFYFDVTQIFKGYEKAFEDDPPTLPKPDKKHK